MNVVVPDKRSDRVRSIGHYILAKTIGEGTFGKVKLGTHILTGENVAVKILEKERIVDVADVERVAREIHILKLIRHPHIIQLYEIIETPRQLYLIMEYASGGELFDYIVQNSRVKESEAVKFFHQILVGVEKMHEINVVHRDLKPENLLLDEQKNIKIVDFGLSNTYLPGQLLKTACGSPCYAAPEMIAGHRYVPGLCDMWSCGVILFALLCGYLPFEDPNTSALYRKIMNADYKCPSFVSHNGRDLIRRLLTIDPTKRVTPRSLKNHPWYLGLIRVTNLKDRPPDLQFAGNGCQVPECQKCQREKRSCFIDDEVINQIRELGFPRDYAVQCIQLNKHNHATTTYYLLLAKKTRLKEQLLIDNAIREKFASSIQSVEAETPVERHAPEDTLTAPSSTAPGDDLVQQCATAPHTQQPPKPTRPQSPPTHPNSRSPPPYPPPPPPRQSHLPHPQSAQESSAPPVSRVSPAPQSHMTPPLMLPDMNVESSLRYPAPAIQQQPGIQPAAPQTPLPASSRAVSIPDRVQEPLTSRNAMMGRPQIGLNLRQLMSPRAASPIYTGLRNTQVTSTPFTPALSARLHDGYRDSTTKCNAHAVTSAVGTPRFSFSGHNMTPRTPLPMRLLSQYTPQPRTSMHRQAHAPQADPPRQTSACGETPERTVAVPITARPHAKPVTVPLTARTHTQTAAVPTKLPMSARGPPTASFNQQPIQKYQGVQLASREKYRGAFSFSVMSRKPMKHAIVEVKRALTANRVDFKQTATTAFACQRPSLRFDVHLKEDGPLTYVRLTRISGELWLYNDTCSTLLSHMRL